MKLLDVGMRQNAKLCGALDEVWPIHMQVRVRSVTTRETGQDTLEEEMPPFPLTLGFNAAIPPCSRVATPRARGNSGIEP